VANYPFTYDFKSARANYGSLLETSKYQKPPEYWTNQEQQVVHPTSEALSGLAKFGFGLSALSAVGFIKTNSGNIWDKYITGIRSIEEYSPGGLLRTFQLSNMVSPFASKVQDANLFIKPDLLQKNTAQAHYLKSLIGGNNSFERLVREGVTLRDHKLFWGQGEEVALKYASALTGTGHNTAQRIAAGYARHLGFDESITKKVPLQHFFSSIEPRPGVINPELAGEAATIIGGQSRLQAGYRYASAIGTEAVSRFNRLLNSPLEIPPFSWIGKFAEDKFGVKLALGVKEASGAKMLGKLSLKYGLGLGALALGYETADWAVRRSSLFNNTILDEGITAGVATLGVKANLLASKAAAITGLHDYREKQEEIAPGSTSLQKLAAFPIVGATSGGFGFYGYKLWNIYKQHKLTPNASPTEIREAAETAIATWATPELKNAGKLLTSEQGLYKQSNLLGKLWRKIASPNEAGELLFKKIGKLTPGKATSIVGGILGTVAILPFLPGALIPSQRPEELRDIYSGRKEVRIKKGQGWLSGRTPYEGEGGYFTQHWYPRLIARPKQKVLWGSEEDEQSPLSKWFKKEFTYDIERRMAYEAPAPVSRLPFSEVPLIGPLLANTVGRLIKPQKFIRRDEWERGGYNQVENPGFGQKIATDIGEQLPGKPINPSNISQVVNDEAKRLAEMSGLFGFGLESLKGAVTGTSQLANQQERLEDYGRLSGLERDYYERELGDIFGLSEAFRRLFPHRDKNISLYNPLTNQAPSWLPEENDRSINFHRGSYYTAIAKGEERLPGRGFASLHPELEGVSPEDYPDIYRYKILADVAPYSDKLKEYKGRIMAARHREGWTEQDEEIFQQTNEQLKVRKGGKEFQEYQYLSSTGGFGKSTMADEGSAILAEINRQQANAKEKPSTFNKLFGGYWEAISHNIETPLEQLTPLSPGAKFTHQRSAIERYEKEVVYGSSSSFWQHPIRDFIKPFIESSKHAFGKSAVPEDLKSSRALTSYFDMLKYVKFTRLGNIARQVGDTQAVKEFDTQKNQTMFGINPYTYNYRDLLKALPAKERDYFLAFQKAETEEERKRILEIVPENEKDLLVARWKMLAAEKIKKAVKSKSLSDNQIQEAEQEVGQIYQQSSTEGMPTSKELFAEFSKTRTQGENYADWYRRQYLLPNEGAIPGPDWVGWLGSVSLDDIRLKVTQTIAAEIHSQNLWESEEKTLPYKPYINEEAINPIVHPQIVDKNELRSQLNDILAIKKVRGDVFITNSDTNETNVDISVDNTPQLLQQLGNLF
jgi:hypothetical protein